MNFDTAREALERHIDLAATGQAAAGAVVGILLAAAFFWSRRPLVGLVEKKIKPSRADRICTFIAASMASTLAAHTMWLIIGTAMPIWLKWCTVAYLEVFVFGSVLRSRYCRLLHAQGVEDLLKQNPKAIPNPREIDIDGISVWVVAIGSAVLGYVEAPTPAEKIFRALAPLISAFSWERGLVGELRQYKTRKQSGIQWNNPVEWVAVRLGLASPTAEFKTAASADRARRLGQVVDAGYRAGVDSRMPWKLSHVIDAYSSFRYHRRLRAVQIKYGSSPELLAEIKAGVAALSQADQAISPKQLAHLDPWGDPAADRKALDRAQSELEQARAETAAAETARSSDLAALRDEMEQMRDEARRFVEDANTRLAEARAEIVSERARAEAAEARAGEAQRSAGGRSDLLQQMLDQARKDVAAAREDVQRAEDQRREELADARAQFERTLAEQLRAATVTRAPAPPKRAAGPAVSRVDTIAPVTIAGLPEFDPERPCGCLRNGKGTDCGWTLAEHVTRKADQVQMVLSYLESHKIRWFDAGAERVGKSLVERACRTIPDDPDSSIAKGSTIQNQVAWLFDQLRDIHQEQTTPV